MKTKYWVVGLLAVAIIGLALLFSSKNSHVASDASLNTASTENAALPASGSLASLISRNGSFQCDASRGAGSNATTGTVYISGGRIRGDFETINPQAGKIQSHMISDGTDTYVWSSAAPMGFKMQMQKNDMPDSNNSGTQDMYKTSYDYHCSAWTADVAKFVLPTDIQFKEMTIPKAPANAGVAPTGMSCSMCDQAPAGPARDQCKKSLHCL